MGKLTINNISHSFDKTNVLNNVNLEIEDGELFTLLGPSGCGKTTLLRIIAGFIKPTEGEIFLTDKNITNVSPELRNIGIVFQSYALFSHMDVLENVKYGLKLKKISKKQIEETAKNYLELVDLYDYRNRKITELSGGQQQRVALARSLAVEPEILLLDEPLSNLDASLREKMREEIRNVQKKLNITTVFVTHDQKEALTISDRIAVFNKGQCVQVDSPIQLYNKPANSFIANFVGEANAIIDDKGNEIFVRPERIKLHETANKLQKYNMENHLKGIIKAITFSGSSIEYTIDVNSKLFKVIELNNGDNRRNINDEVYLEINW